MSTVQFRRLPRLVAPKMPGGEVHLEPPPEVPRVIPGSVVQKILPVVMIVAMLGMVAYAFVGKSEQNPQFLLFPIVMMVVSAVGMFAGGRGGGQAKAEMNEDRKDYLRYLGQMRERARETAREQRAAMEWSHPDPAALWSIASSRRMWERRVGDPDFCHVRICRGAQRLATLLVPPQTGPVDELEPITKLALRQFVRAHSLVPELPIALSIRGFAAIGLSGEPAAARGLARAMVAQLATFHTPDDLLVAVVTSGRAKVDWEWAKWLPHVQHPSRVDGAGPRRMMAGSLAQIEELLGEQLRDRPRFSRNAQPPGDGPHIVVVIDGGEVTGAEQILLEEGIAGVTLLDLSTSLGTLTSRRGLQLVIEDAVIGARGAAGVEPFGSPDSLAVVEAEAVARALSPFRLGAVESPGEDEPLLSNTGLLGLLGLPDDPHAFDVAQAWRPRPIRDRLRVPIGLGEFGQPVELDIKEASQGGMGPHGLCVGATGSGKSEFLRTLVLGLVATHSSATLNLVLVDFKGGATFLGVEHAPHVAAVITNLADDLTQVARMQDALAGEMNRRQELLRTAGNFSSVKDYEKARGNGADLDPLPALFIVIDEFSELLAQQPELIDLFVAIGRLGRSLQMHLLLASQRLEEGKLRGLESHLSYRIGLKTFSAGESRAVLGVPDAYELPSVPGSGYLKFDTASMERFKAAYVSGPYRAGRVLAAPSTIPVTSDRRPRLFVPDYVDLPEAPEPVVQHEVPEPKVTEPTVLDVVVAKLRGQGPPAHEVWLPPLDVPPSLDQLLPPLSVTEDRGLSPAGFTGNGRLTVPVGIVDKPYEQRRDLLWADLSGSAGHVVVTGGPQSGKSTLLRSLLMSLALTHTPEEVQFFCIDLGGGTLASLDGLPHSGGVAGRLEPDTVRRIIAEVTGLLTAREQLFRSLGIDSMADFRARRQRDQPQLREDLFGDVFLVIDGWHSFRQEFDVSDLETRVVNLATQGLSYGVHVVIGATRWAEIRPVLKDLLGTRFELRLGDPGESDIDRRVAANVPSGRPGRGLSRDKLHFLAALPRIDAMTSAADVGTAVAGSITRIRDAWPGRRGPRVRLLPERIPYVQLPASVDQRPHLIPIGINEAELATVSLDFAAEPHFLCFADGESGKTTLLRTIARGIVARCTPEQARIIIVDYRRTMLGFLESSEHLLEYGMSPDVLAPIVSDVQRSMRNRLPGAGITPQQLRDHSWWSGPELYVLVDDYDLVAPQGGANPLAPLLEFLAQAKDVGLHLIVARRCGGAARALFEPVIARLRELSTPGIVMSGSLEEGPLLGNVKPSPMPPGRGTLVDRKAGRQLVQVAWLPPE
ncbi:MAG: type VII secretion protein EccCa [Pseudonocardiaceae bacterium]